MFPPICLAESRRVRVYTDSLGPGKPSQNGCGKKERPERLLAPASWLSVGVQTGSLWSDLQSLSGDYVDALLIEGVPIG